MNKEEEIKANIKTDVPPTKGTWVCPTCGFTSKIPLTGCPKCHEILIFKPEKTDVKVKAEDLDKTKKIIEEQLNQLNVNDVINNILLTVIPPILKETIRMIDLIEVEGKRVRVKFK